MSAILGQTFIIDAVSIRVLLLVHFWVVGCVHWVNVDRVVLSQIQHGKWSLPRNNNRSIWPRFLHQPQKYIYLLFFFLPLNKECFFSFHSLCGKIFHMTWKWWHALLQLAEISWWPRPFCSAVKMMMEAEGVQSFTLNIVTILMTPSRALSVNHFYPQNTKWKCTSVWNETQCVTHKMYLVTSKFSF